MAANVGALGFMERPVALTTKWQVAHASRDSLRPFSALPTWAVYALPHITDSIAVTIAPDANEFADITAAQLRSRQSLYDCTGRLCHR